MNSRNLKCPECDGSDLHYAAVDSGGLYGPALLLGLGSFLRLAKLRVLVCAGCGLTRFYAERHACAKIQSARVWRRVVKT